MNFDKQYESFRVILKHFWFRENILFKVVIFLDECDFDYIVFGLKTYT